MSAQPQFSTQAELSSLGASNAMSAVLAQNWWAIALRGVFAILFGIVAVLLPVPTIASLVLVFAAYMLVDGVFDIVAALRAAQRQHRWGWLLVEGIADIAAGAIAFLWPHVTILAFIILLAAWAIVTGVMMCAAAFRLNFSHGRWLMALGGVVSVLWGIFLIFWPLTGAVALTIWMGAYALIFGCTLLALAFRLRNRHRALEGAPAQAPGV